jgi:hypothetical protein
MSVLSASVIEPLVWFVGGFLGGSLATYLILSKLAQNSGLEQPVAATDPAPKPRRRITALHVMAAIIVVLTILSAVQSWLAQQANTRLTAANARLSACLVRYANDTADAIEARSKASGEAQVALVQMWSTIFAQPQTDAGRAESRRVFEDWLNKAKASIEAQKTNPYPPAPRDVCPDSGG